MAADAAPKKVKPPPPSTSAWGRFWWRYSPNFELPISSAASISLHVFVVLLFVLGLTAFSKRNHRPPGVDCVAVVEGDGDGAAAGFGDDGLPPGAGAGTGGDSGQALEQSTSTANDAPVPVTASAQLETELAPDALVETDFSTSEPSSTAGDVARRAENAAQSIRDRLAQGLNRSGRGTGASGGDGTGSGSGGDGSGGGGKGGGGGNAARGRAARQARWILRFNTRNAADYVAQIRGLGASIAFINSDGTYQCLDLSRDPPGQTKRKEGDITEMFWMDSDPASVRRVADFLGMTAKAGFFVTFLPQQLEERLFKLELAYRGLPEDRIKSTDFEVVRTGGGYDVQVVSQESR